MDIATYKLEGWVSKQRSLHTETWIERSIRIKLRDMEERSRIFNIYVIEFLGGGNKCNRKLYNFSVTLQESFLEQEDNLHSQVCLEQIWVF